MTMPTFTEAQLAILHVLLNSISTGVNGEFTDFEEALHAAASVETVGDLPTSGNWLGRIIFVEETETPYFLTAMPSSWSSIYRLDDAAITPEYGDGWQLPSVNKLRRRSGWARAEFNAFATETIPVGGTIMKIPVGFRGDDFCWTQGWDTFSPTNESFQIYYNWETAHEFQTREVIPEGASLAFSVPWMLL